MLGKAGRIRTAIFGVALVMSGCTFSNNSPEATPAPTADPAPSDPSTTNVPVSLVNKYQNAQDLCDDEALDVDDMETARAIELVKEIDFVENDYVRLKATQDAIRYAETLEEAESIAQDYFDSLGIQTTFRDPHLEGFVSNANIKAEKGPENTLEDHQKQAAIGNIVHALAILPRSFYDAFDGTRFYFPDTLHEAIGSITYPQEGGIEEFAIQLPLSTFYSGGDDKKPIGLDVAFHEFAGHNLQVRVCGLSNVLNNGNEHFDPVLQEIISRVPPVIPFSNPTDFEGDETNEYFSELAPDLFENSISRNGTDRRQGNSNVALGLYINRLSKFTGMDVEDIVALSEFMRAFGGDIHPLEAIDRGLSPMSRNRFSADFDPRGDDDNIHIVPTSYGDIALSCDRVLSKAREDESASCVAKVTASTADVLDPAMQERGWLQDLRDEIISGPAPRGTEYAYATIGGHDFDPNYPQITEGTIEIEYLALR